MTSNSSLYRVPQPDQPPKKSQKSAPLSASNLAFNATLSSLLATSSSKPQISRPAPRPQKPSKDSIFTTHNKGSKKRAAADIFDGLMTQKHSTTSQEVDAATLHRSKRKMEEKARLYASMKRGDYVPRKGGRDKEGDGLVDFDRKWADGQEEKDKDTSSDDYASSADEDGGAEMVEYEDEFGRMRKGTKAQVERMERTRNAAAYAGEELASFAARPERPSNLIVGDTVQTAAFNPDEPIAMQMERLAQKRDRSLTPPPEVHYDATKEVRSKGVGFYQFSRDEGERQAQMGNLEQDREETERLRREKDERKSKREKALEERKKLIAEKRGKKLADKFLDELDIGVVLAKEEEAE